MKTTTPLTTACMRHELDRHEQRIRELRALTGPLQRLQSYVPALRCRGVVLGPDAVNLDASRRGRKAVYITAPIADPANHRLYTALAELGFKTRERRDHGTYAQLLMCDGGLRISLAAALPLPVAQMEAIAS
jgi:hypothetical protein